MKVNNKALSERILRVVCDHFDQPTDIVTSTSRKREHLIPRQVAMKLIREETTMSLNGIGEMFSGEGRRAKDHATVLHAIRTLRDLREWKYGPYTIDQHIEQIRVALKGEMAKEYPIQIRRYGQEYDIK